MTRKHLMTIGGLVVVLVAASAFVGWRLLRDDAPQRGRLGEALAMAPASAQRFSWTDWTAVRRELGADLDTASSAALVQDLLDRGYEEDLTSTSTLLSSAVVMQDRLGFSPASLDWELYSQQPGSQSLLMRPGPGVDLAAVREALRAAGYEEPQDAGGLWFADPNSDAITTDLTPELNYVGLDDDRGLIVASDSEPAALTAQAAVDDAAGSPVPDDAVAQVGEPVSAALYTGTEVCGALAMGQADPSDEAQGEQLVEAAGEVNPMTGFVMALEPGGGVVVAMSFENEEQARVNATTRATLASGPAPGQGGDFSERFTLGEVAAVGDVVRMDLAPVEGAYVLSDLSTGPLLFATC